MSIESFFVLSRCHVTVAGACHAPEFPSLPGANFIEVVAGTGATTDAVPKVMDQGYTSYTFTDVSTGFFLPADERFG